MREKHTLFLRNSVLLFLALTAAVRVANAQATPPAVTKPKPGPIHIVAKSTGTSPRRATSGASAPVCLDSSGNPGICNVQYYGGPVISDVDVVVVYWGSNVSSVVDCGGGQDSHGNCIGVSQFYSSVANSTYLDMLQEYDTAGVNATAGSKTGQPGSNQLIGRGTLHSGSPFTITPSAGNSGTTLDDSNIQNEIQNQIAAGNLPAPATDSTGNVNTLYMVYFPPGVTITAGGLASCVPAGFCGYHSTYNLNNLDVPYGVVPDFGKGSGCDVGCGGGSEWQNITSTSSHELAEAATDTAVGIGTTVDYPLAWYDAINGEIGDPCNQFTDTLQYDGNPFVIQQLLSQKAYNLDPNAGCVSPGTPALTLTAPAASVPGTAFNVTVAVNNGDGSNYLGTVHFTSSDGSASLPADYTFTEADGGTHIFNGGVTLNTAGSETITVADAHQASTSGSKGVSVAKNSTTTSLTSSLDPSQYSQPVTFTATVTGTPGAPSGSVTFTDGVNPLGSVPLSGGSAALTTGALAIGSHSITASYSGDASFTGSNSAPLSQIVNQESSSTSLTSYPNSSYFDQLVTFTATVSGNSGTPTGTVTFTDGVNTLGSAPLAAGTATLNALGLAVGSHSINATYSGDATFTSSSSGPLTQLVTQAGTTITLVSSGSPSFLNELVTYSSTVTGAFGGTPTGTVTFMQGATKLQAVPLANAQASYTTSYTTVGTRSLTAVYSGDGNYFTGTSPSISQVVNATPGDQFLLPVSYTVPTSPYASPVAVAVGDFNGDGKLDMAVTSWNPSFSPNINLVTVLLGNGDGTFQPGVDYSTVGAEPDSIVVADVNHDGKLDILTADAGSLTVSVLLGNGDGTFQPAMLDSDIGALEGSPFSLAIGDLNGDGNLDLVLPEEADNNVSVILGNGDGTFNPATNYPVGTHPRFAAIGDFNGDGKMDLAVANSGPFNSTAPSNVSILLGNGDGTFQPAVNYTVGVRPNSLVVGDFNRDGKLDLAVDNDTTTGIVNILFGNGDGTFQSTVNHAVGPYSVSITSGDFNGDGKLDLAITDDNGVMVLSNTGNGTFQNSGDYAPAGRSLAAGDFNGDGALDLAVVNSGALAVSVLLNAGITVTPTKLVFPTEPIGTTSPAKTVKLTNPSVNSNLAVTSIVPSGDFAQTNNCPHSLLPRKSCTIMVTFTPTASGLRTGTITINLSTGPLLVALSGAGPGFSISASPSSVSVTRGQQVTSTISVSPAFGFNQTVALSCTAPAAKKITCAVVPSSVTLDGTNPGTSTLTINTLATTPAGTDLITVYGTLNSVTHSAKVTLKVQ